MPIAILNRAHFNLLPAASPSAGAAAGSGAALGPVPAAGARPPAPAGTGAANDATGGDSSVTHGVQLTSSNTGIPAGTSLSTDSIGGADITTGATDTIFDPTSFCNITADNQTFTRCRFLDGSLLVVGNGNTFVNCEFPGGLSISSSNDNTFTRCRIHTTSGDLCHITGDQGGAPLDQCFDNQFIETLFDNPTTQPGDHADAMQIRGSDGLQLIRCRLDMGEQISGNYKNAALFPQPANGGNENLTVQDCYFNGGGYMVYITEMSGTTTFTGNRFGPDITFGYVLNETAFVPTTWTGNVVDATEAAVPYTTN